MILANQTVFSRSSTLETSIRIPQEIWVPRASTVEDIAEKRIEIRHCLPRKEDLSSAKHEAKDHGWQPDSATRPQLHDELADKWSGTRPLLVALGSAAGLACAPSGYDATTLSQAFGGCDAVVLVAGLCSEILYHGVARLACSCRKVVLIEAAPSAVGAWLSAVRRSAPQSVRLEIEPNDAAFGDSQTCLPLA